jgi:phosphohistidine phosphatase
MQLFILRHAVAIPRDTRGYPTDDRPLSEEGIAKFIKCAKAINILTGRFDIIISSPLVRALHTAKILAEHTSFTKDIIVTEYLLPGSPQRIFFKFLKQFNKAEKICITGHEPMLGFLASKFIGQDESVIELKKGAVCRIDIDKLPPEKPGTLVWLMQPKQLMMINKVNIDS